MKITLQELWNYGQSGHVWQGRFKAFLAQDDEHLATVVRYVERKPLRAGLVERAEAWPWSSLGNANQGPRLDAQTMPRRADWVEFVNTPMTEAEGESVRLSILRDRPFGSAIWTGDTAQRLGLTYSLRPRGRPRSLDPSP